MKTSVQHIKKLTQNLLVVGIMTTGVVGSAFAQSGALASLFGQSQKPKFLPVNQAFKVQTAQQGETLTVTFDITPEHYIYKDKLTIAPVDGLTALPPQFDRSSTMIDDPEFGTVAVFEEDVVATFTLKSEQNLNSIPITIKWQGCAKAGLCYPPETIKTTITLAASKVSESKPSENRAIINQAGAIKSDQKAPINGQTTPSVSGVEPSVAGTSLQDNSPVSAKEQNLVSMPAVTTDTNGQISDQIVSQTGQADLLGVDNHDNAAPTNDGFGGIVAAQTSNDLADKTTAMPQTESSLGANLTALDEKDTNRHQPIKAQDDPFGIKQKPVMAVFLLFLAGLLLAFTPCVYPMIPIVANIVARQKNVSPFKGFLLSLGYGVGVATAYGILGAIIAWLGQAVGILGWLQNTYILAIFAVVFVVLALAMFDLIQLRLPSKLSHALQQKSQMADSLLGSVGGSFLVGLLSALVVSPCVSLPMAGALTAISTSDSVALGFVALFMLGLGLSLPLMMMGALQGKFMPKAGEWTAHVKNFCGLLLLAVAVSLLERIAGGLVIFVAWAMWFALFAVWAFRLKTLLFKAVALMSAVWSVCLMMGMAMGASDPWRPLSNLGMTAQAPQPKADLHITTLAQLDEILARHDKVLVDVTADWCVECRIMERTLFTNRPAELSAYQVVKLDVSKTTEDSKAVFGRYNIFGPPALLIYHNNQLQNVLLGEVKRADFEQALKGAL